MISIELVAKNYIASVELYIYSNFSILQTSPGISEKVFVSLYGGDATDIDGYSWFIDNPTIASIRPTDWYCVITAKEAGYARINITHSKASYPYYMGVYVFADATQISYITTTNNIVTINQGDGEQNISVSLVNGKDSSSNSQFTWEILKEDGIETPIGLSCNGNNAIITPLKAGSCTLRVSHPDISYPLDILCLVTTSQNYIKTKVGASETSVKITLKGGVDGDENNFTWSVKSTAADGSTADVIHLESPHGSVIYNRAV